MANFYLNKPFRLKSVFSHGRLDEVDVGRSVSNNIELIIFTRRGEHRYNRYFGCEIWELDFELIVSEAIWEERFRQSLLKSITDYEKRIINVDVDVKITEVEKFFPVRKVTEIKKKVLIQIEGRMKETNERYYFTTSLFLSPLSR